MRERARLDVCACADRIRMRVRTQLAALVEVATEPIAANQCHFGIGEMDHATLEYCKAHGIAVESYGAIARTGHSLAVNGIHMDAREWPVRAIAP